MIQCRKCLNSLIIFENPESMDDEDFYCNDCKEALKREVKNEI